MKRLALLIALAAVAAPAFAQNAPATRKRLAVIDFDYATVHAYVHDIWGSDVDIGKGVADMLVNQLVRNGTYSLVERKQLDRILQEQNFQQSGRADASTAAQLGRILGVDAIVIGSITQFGRDDKKLGVGGGVRVGGVGIGGIGRRSSKAVVGIDARIVDVRTAEILGVATGFGESKRSGATLVGSASVGGVAAGGGVDMQSSNFASTILGEATRLAVDSLVTELVGAQSRITETVAAIQGLVADVTESEIIINKGTRDGVRVGTEYDIVRGGREIRDPASGRVLRRMTEKVGKVKITSADEGSAVGTVTGAPVRVGDCVGSCPVKP
ncbi:MAG: CsgG/HfaB family protein [Gemmatimonadales bacterium]|nr:CsgG/HfaB family protein [Gemmatimonadales bacterium]